MTDTPDLSTQAALNILHEVDHRLRRAGRDYRLASQTDNDQIARRHERDGDELIREATNVLKHVPNQDPWVEQLLYEALDIHWSDGSGLRKKRRKLRWARRVLLFDLFRHHMWALYER